MNFIPKGKKYFLGRPDKREIPRVKLASIVPMDTSKWDLELSRPVNAPEMAGLLTRYSDRSLEENLFFGEAFLAAAFGRMNMSETNLLTVWETIDSERTLRMYFPMVSERVGWRAKKIWRCWSHDYAPLGVPIVSEHDAGEVLERFIQLVGQIENPAFPALVFNDIPLEGVFAARLREALDGSNTPYQQFATGERAVLKAARLMQTDSGIEITAKKRRQLQRQQRRLAELGELKLECVEDYASVILRFEEFLLLEAKGWKGRKGTSMHTIKQTAAFARQAVTDLAKLGQCAIYSFRIDDKSVASLIVLKANGVYFPWKIAFDQNYSHFSPGALLMFRASEEISGKPDFVRADSLAGPANQLVNLLWKRRMTLGTMILSVGDTSVAYVESISQILKRANLVREKAKKILHRKPQ